MNWGIPNEWECKTGVLRLGRVVDRTGWRIGCGCGEFESGVLCGQMVFSVEFHFENRGRVADAHALRRAIAVVVLVRSVMPGEK